MKYQIEKKHISIGLISFAVIAASIILFFIIYRMHGFMGVVSKIISILMPFVYGLVVAYLLCPVYNIVYKKSKNIGFLNKGKVNKSSFYSRIIATTASIIALMLVLVSLSWMIIPGLIDSMVGIAKTLPDQIYNFIGMSKEIAKDVANSNAMIAGIIDTLIESGSRWVEETIIPGSESVITSLSNSLMSLISGIKNFLIGIIICIFFLNSKDNFAAQARKISYAVFKKENAEKFLYGSHFINLTFGKFINGKLIDSLIIGILCFVFMSTVNWPYAMLISVIVGVTNIIPFFGPFIGAVPSALLILIIDPMTCLYFIIFILALQQLDGNIIGPKILGESIGIPSFWIMFAILVGGGLFGFVGMVLGVPIFACIYEYIHYKVSSRLEDKGLSTDTNDYRGTKGSLNE